ncbi:MAG: hypothetical protein IH820_12765 [Bacteroidetes bacterium]|nr:hypothetical protein [Bacteroidota bacterium]
MYEPGDLLVAADPDELRRVLLVYLVSEEASGIASVDRDLALRYQLAGTADPLKPPPHRARQ